MNITEDQTIQDVQEAFSSIFPGLKLEFYLAKHANHEGSSPHSQLDQWKRLGHLNLKTEIKQWEPSPDWSVAEFEQLMEEKFGLHVQVFRRSNNIWLQTSVTDDWTLATQNRKGIHSEQTIEE